MSNVVEIENAISALSVREAEEIREWLEHWLEDQHQMTPEFQASIERGKADIARLDISVSLRSVRNHVTHY